LIKDFSVSCVALILTDNLFFSPLKGTVLINFIKEFNVKSKPLVEQITFYECKRLLETIFLALKSSEAMDGLIEKSFVLCSSTIHTPNVTCFFEPFF
jgi:hypothetical protein